MRVILRGKWGAFYARIAAAVDSARVLVLFSARILFVAGLERDFKCFSARIASAVDSAREMRCFPACPKERAQKNRSLISEAAIVLGDPPGHIVGIQSCNSV